MVLSYYLTNWDVPHTNSKQLICCLERAGLVFSNMAFPSGLDVCPLHLHIMYRTASIHGLTK